MPCPSLSLLDSVTEGSRAGKDFLGYLTCGGLGHRAGPQLAALLAVFPYLILSLLSPQFPISREVSKMSISKKQKQLEALFMKILEKVRMSIRRPSNGGGSMGVSSQSHTASGVQAPPRQCFTLLHPPTPEVRVYAGHS